MTIRKILTRAIKKAGGDGLCNPRAGCGCGLQDLFICEGPCLDGCVIAKKKHCRDCDDAEDCCPADLDDFCFFAIEEKK